MTNQEYKDYGKWSDNNMINNKKTKRIKSINIIMSSKKELTSSLIYNSKDKDNQIVINTSIS